MIYTSIYCQFPSSDFLLKGFKHETVEYGIFLRLQSAGFHLKEIDFFRFSREKN